MSKKSIREKRRALRRKQNLILVILIGGAAVAVALIIGGLPSVALIEGELARPSLQPIRAEDVPEMVYDHVLEGTDPGHYNSDPPTSGRHYASTLEVGFYEESDLDGIGPYPEGFLVHNLEHGYVIFWYNCALLDENACLELKDQIQEAMQRSRNFKVIGFPRESINGPVVMTSWTRMLRFDEFDVDLAMRFVQENRNKAPEPNAP